MHYWLCKVHLNLSALLAEVLSTIWYFMWFVVNLTLNSVLESGLHDSSIFPWIEFEISLVTTNGVFAHIVWIIRIFGLHYGGIWELKKKSRLTIFWYWCGDIVDAWILEVKNGMRGKAGLRGSLPLYVCTPLDNAWFYLWSVKLWRWYSAIQKILIHKLAVVCKWVFTCRNLMKKYVWVKRSSVFEDSRMWSRLILVFLCSLLTKTTFTCKVL